MARNITRVQWSATDLPWGIKFDELTGTFTGAPTDVGEYTVPVRVKTNYGSDAKDVKIIVRKTYNVCSIGYMAKTFSEDASPDEFGLYHLNMPKADRLQPHYGGFLAYLPDNSYYYCGMSGVASAYNYQNTIQTKTTPYTDEQKQRYETRTGFMYSIASTASASSSNIRQGFYLVLSLKGNILTAYTSGRIGEKGSSTSSYAGGSAFSISNTYEGIILPENTYLGFGRVFPSNISWLCDNGTSLATLTLKQASKTSMNTTASIKKEELGYRAVKVFDRCGDVPITFLSDTGKFDGLSNFVFYSGTIKDAWFVSNRGYVLNTDNNLYEYDSDNYTFPLLGNWNVKKLEMCCMSAIGLTYVQDTAMFLTEEGDLYHKGVALEGICETHDEFTRILEGVKVHDFTLSAWSSIPTGKTSADVFTLTILKED